MPGDEHFPVEPGGSRSRNDDRPRQSSSRGRVPPHNIEAEESVLGACLLAREAIGTVSEMALQPADFYKPAHRHIFDAIRSLYSASAPADTVTVADELRRAGLLAEVGGAEALHELQNATPAISSAGHYAKIVQETALLRQLIYAAGDIAELAYSEPDDVVKALDMAETRVFNVAEQRVTDSIRTLEDLLPGVMDRLQETYDRGDIITGVPTGYSDLDELLSGLQDSALYIVGARPAMGKCVAWDTPMVDVDTGELVTAAEMLERADRRGHGTALSLDASGRRVPAAMSHALADGLKPVFRVRTRSGRVVQVTETHPLLTVRGWQPLANVTVGESIAVPTAVPVFGTDDLPDAEIDALARRIDFTDPRASTPPRAFTLSKPSLQRFLATVLQDSDAFVVASRQLAAELVHLALRLGDSLSRTVTPEGVVLRRECPDPDSIPVEVWDDVIKAKGELPWSEINRRCGKPVSHNWHPYRGRVRRETIGRLAEALDDDQLRWWASPDVAWDEIVEITSAGWTQVIDFTVPEHHNFVAADMYLHNTAFGLGIAAHVAMHSTKPVLVFSLEMAHHELTQRILASEARVDSTKIRTGKLAEADWAKIGKAIGRLEVPLFLDDNPRVTVMEIRAKARRIKARYGGLGLIVIDYLQLMGGNGAAENRQLEVSEISRNLKILARELEVPIIALSQLSRQLEARADKRPMLSDLRESGCLTASTRLVRADTNQEVTLGELVELGATDIPVWSLDERYKLVAGNLSAAFPSGVKETFRLRLASGRWVDASANHPFLTLDGWQPVEILVTGARIASARRIPATPQVASGMSDAQLTLLGHLIGDGCTLDRHALQYTTTDPANVDAVVEAAVEFGITARVKAERTWTQVYLAAPFRLTHGRHNPISDWMRGMGVWNRRSWEKFVPAPLFGEHPDRIALFLRHLWATDGSVSAPSDKSASRIYYATSSRQLADDVASLLLRLDIRARVRIVPHATQRTSYHVDVSGRDDQLRFADTIGVHGARGARLSELVDRVRPKQSNPNVDAIPADVWEHVRHKSLANAGVTTRQLAQHLGMSYCGSTLYKSGVSRSRMQRLADITDDPWLDDLANSDVLWDEIVAIEPLGEQPVFDATIDVTHNFVANGIVAHNSLEQDADVVMFLYRDEVYHPDSPDKGSAEVIIAKHRAGPIGTKRLVFLGQYTRFDNAARGV